MKVALYKGTRPGLQSIYSHLVRWWTRSPYSHAELVFGDGMAASSSYIDGGVRFRRIAFNPDNWDFVDTSGNESVARQWFIDHDGQGYDLLGNVSFVLGFVRDASDKWSCAESIAAALGYAEAWRFSPAVLGVAAAHSQLQPEYHQ